MSKKLSYDYVYNYFKDHGCLLLEIDYINNSTKMNYICKCGIESKINFNHFKKGHRCINCSGSKKLTIEYIKYYFENNNCKLLEDEYIGNKTPMRYICSCGNESKINFNNFSKGVRCINCGIIKLTGKNHPRYNTDRSRKNRLNYLLFDKRKVSILKSDVNYVNYINNRGNNFNQNIYDIDHVFPRIAFIDNDLDLKYDPILIKKICNSKDNLRIITEKENLSKGCKYNREEFMKWFNNKINDLNLGKKSV